jgi:SSS family solute:Na+ symporter
VKVEFFIFLFAYFLLVLLVGFVFSRRMKNLVDFFLASKNLPGIVVYASLCASWFGATSTLVSTDEAYRIGVSSFWVMGVPAILTVLFLAIFLSGPIRRLPILSLPDLVELRYGRAVRHLASGLVIWYMAVLASSQMVALGNFLKAFIGGTYLLSLTAGTLVVLAYSIFGGFFSVAATDFFQFLILSAGVFSLLFFLIDDSSLKSVSLFAAELGKEQYFNFFFDFKRNLLIVLSFTLAWIISPIAWQRIQAARSGRDARRALFAASGTFFLLYGSVVLIGMLSLPLLGFEPLGGPLLSEMISSKTGFFLRGLLFVAVLAAVMSTMDTAINTGALSLTRDVYAQLFSSSKDKGLVLVGRLSTFFVGGLAFLIATKFQSILRTLGLASEIMAEGLFIPGLAMIFLKKKFPLAGFLSLLLGGGFSMVSFLEEAGLLALNWPSWPYSVPYGLGLSLAGFIIGIGVEACRRKLRPAASSTR